MAKEGTTVADSFWRDLFKAGIYKRSQGRIARQVTFATLFAFVALGCWALFNTLLGSQVRYPVTLVVFVIGLWLSFRAVNMPRFADFLISVEAEMNKVTWPSRTELINSSIVVIITIFGLAFLLLFFDTVWRYLLMALGVYGV